MVSRLDPNRIGTTPRPIAGPVSRPASWASRGTARVLREAPDSPGFLLHQLKRGAARRP